MKEYSLRKSQPTNPLPYILLVGLLIGIALSWILFNEKASPTQPVLTETPSPLPIISTIATATPLQIVEITPNVAIQSIARVGHTAPDFALKTLDGKEIKLSDLKGKAVLINLWASWCPPCRYEMPAIQVAYEKYKNKGLVVLGIDFTVQDNLKDVNAFVKELKLTFPILLDETGKISVGLYGMRGLPMSFFIDTEGILQRIQVGAMLPEKLDGYLADIMPK
jgi:cytochrome c biogenesis protein CcmG/thiol:disulfide interchange protein DsbE